MIDARVLNQMKGVSSDVTERLTDTVNDIVQLSWPYKYRKKAFTFDISDTLDVLVNTRIGELCDCLIEDNDARVQECYGYTDNLDAAEDMYAYVNREFKGSTRDDRYGKYCGFLRDTAEAWLAIGFAIGLSQWQVVSNVINGNPTELAKARRDTGYAADLDSRVLDKDVPSWLTVIGQRAVTEAYHFGEIEEFSKDPDIVGYKVERGSSYPCDVCSDLTSRVWPLDEIVLPAHPHCVCYMVPVFRGEENL